MSVTAHVSFRTGPFAQSWREVVRLVESRSFPTAVHFLMDVRNSFEGREGLEVFLAVTVEIIREGLGQDPQNTPDSDVCRALNEISDSQVTAYKRPMYTRHALSTSKVLPGVDIIQLANGILVRSAVHAVEMQARCAVELDEHVAVQIRLLYEQFHAFPPAQHERKSVQDAFAILGNRVVLLPKAKEVHERYRTEWNLPPARKPRNEDNPVTVTQPLQRPKRVRGKKVRRLSGRSPMRSHESADLSPGPGSAPPDLPVTVSEDRAPVIPTVEARPLGSPLLATSPIEVMESAAAPEEIIPRPIPVHLGSWVAAGWHTGLGPSTPVHAQAESSVRAGEHGSPSLPLEVAGLVHESPATAEAILVECPRPRVPSIEAPSPASAKVFPREVEASAANAEKGLPAGSDFTMGNRHHLAPSSVDVVESDEGSVHGTEEPFSLPVLIASHPDAVLVDVSAVDRTASFSKEPEATAAIMLPTNGPWPASAWWASIAEAVAVWRPTTPGTPLTVNEVALADAWVRHAPTVGLTRWGSLVLRTVRDRHQLLAHDVRSRIRTAFERVEAETQQRGAAG